MSGGVMFDTAQTLYQVCVWYGIGDATPTLHLFMSDDSATTASDPRDFEELVNSGYAPLPIPSGYLQFQGSDTPQSYAVIDAEFNLGVPVAGDDTIFGWWIGGASTRLAEEIPLWGGNFDPPVVIPPAGANLTLAKIDLQLHGCVTIPPPPPVPRGLAIEALHDNLCQLPRISPALIPPANFVYTPADALFQWSFRGVSSGVAGQGSAFAPPDTLGTLAQVIFIQSGSYVEQVFRTTRAGSCRPSLYVTERLASFGASLLVELDGNIIEGPAGLAVGWQWLLCASASTLDAGDHTIKISNAADPATDTTLFFGGVDLNFDPFP